jgi:hypothetical protein
MFRNELPKFRVECCSPLRGVDLLTAFVKSSISQVFEVGDHFQKPQKAKPHSATPFESLNFPEPVFVELVGTAEL